MLTVQYILPLVSAVKLIRAKTVKDRELEFTRLLVYFMVQAAITCAESQLGLWRLAIKLMKI